ncbi:GNAT family N-acetyltransferase [Herpetosiphon gulosus]|uniref:Streptothricin acetyltransferase n=1 Tax=Herpetosiphon gulosus TaxID=1973496 RepID=A0ABP9WWK3_9CHLR
MNNIQLRPLNWPHDRVAIGLLDTSFSTNTIYQLHQTALTMHLALVDLASPFEKHYDLSEDYARLPQHDWVFVAEAQSQVVGLAAVAYQQWNRRAVLEHCYVDRRYRGRGLGRQLLTAAIAAARQLSARCLWLETQTTNPAAIAFYRTVGFGWCGSDWQLYDPSALDPREIALFFSYDLA